MPAGRRRSPATMPRYHAGRAPSNKGQRYPAEGSDPPNAPSRSAMKPSTETLIESISTGFTGA